MRRDGRIRNFMEGSLAPYAEGLSGFLVFLVVAFTVARMAAAAAPPEAAKTFRVTFSLTYAQLTLAAAAELEAELRRQYKGAEIDVKVAELAARVRLDTLRIDTLETAPSYRHPPLPPSYRHPPLHLDNLLSAPADRLDRDRRRRTQDGDDAQPLR